MWCVCGPEHPREFSGAAGRTCKDIKSGKLHTRRIQGDNELHMKANWEQATAETSDKTKCRLRPHMNCLGVHFFLFFRESAKSEKVLSFEGLFCCTSAGEEGVLNSFSHFSVKIKDK